MILWDREKSAVCDPAFTLEMRHFRILWNIAINIIIIIALVVKAVVAIIIVIISILIFTIIIGIVIITMIIISIIFITVIQLPSIFLLFPFLIFLLISPLSLLLSIYSYYHHIILLVNRLSLYINFAVWPEYIFHVSADLNYFFIHNGHHLLGIILYVIADLKSVWCNMK